MKKYVLNIDRMCCGKTANALVLNQVDEELPTLIPSIDERMKGIPAFIRKWQRIYPEFNPPSLTDKNAINEYIIDFNLELQTNFKKNGHDELYFMDDTLRQKPTVSLDDVHATYSMEKTYLHALDGRSKDIVVGKDEDENDIIKVFNSSQFNVLFPFKKMSSKSMYASQLTVESAKDIDDLLEKSRGITLQGRCSFQKCLQGLAYVGSNLYMLSPNVVLNEQPHKHEHANGMTIVNGYNKGYPKPYHFPHTMTLFQPSQDMANSRNLAIKTKKNGQKIETNFVKWFNERNRKTMVSLSDTYGGNESLVKFHGVGSYEIELATYSPTGLIVCSPETTDKYSIVPLTNDKFREIRNGDDARNTYSNNRKYIFDNSELDYRDPKTNEWKYGQVGFHFNLYDNFITGQDRVLKIYVPKDSDSNKMALKFKWLARRSNLFGDFEFAIEVNEKKVNDVYQLDSEHKEASDECVFQLSDMVLDGESISIVVRIHHNVDYGKRNNEQEYRKNLKEAGVSILDLRIVGDGSSESPTQLTFGSYVNEDGITEEEKAKRYLEFWKVSKYKEDITYQTVLESSVNNTITAGLAYPNNYSSGDLYGDVFATKSMLDSRYDMNLSLEYFDPETWNWQPTNDNYGKLVQMLHASCREYIGLGQCSNSLYLTYKPMDMAIPINDNTGIKPMATSTENPEGELKYQMVETVKNINRFESSIKHKSNVFSVVVQNSNLEEDTSDTRNEELEKYKSRLRESVTQFVRNACNGVVPVHTQLFDVQFV